jgi:hypothetical protein
MADYVDAFEEAGLLREFIGVLDYVDSTLAAVKRHGPPSAIARMLAYDGPRMLDGFAREYRGYVGKVRSLEVNECEEDVCCGAGG